MKKVTILYKSMPQYRREFFNLLRTRLQKQNIELELIYGRLNNKNDSKGDQICLEWAKFVDNFYLRVLGSDIYYQPVLKMVKNSDLVIVEQANGLLINYFLLLRHIFNKQKFSFWGHGKNYQGKKNSASEMLKKLILSNCHWWFAYTPEVKNYIQSCGFPRDRITNVQNSIDTKSLIRERAKIDEAQIKQLRSDIGIKGQNVGIYCGSLYKEKQIEFLLDTCLLVRESIKDFEIIIIGAGPDAEIIKKASDKHTWIHYLGAKFGKEKVPYFALADINLTPAAVGLVILDTFALETPMITTNSNNHGPEGSYIIHGRNGVIADNTISSYSKAVVDTLQNKELLATLITGCRKSINQYSIENMVKNFTNGILLALK